jgi:hypothetical protein
MDEEPFDLPCDECIADDDQWCDFCVFSETWTDEEKELSK